MMLTLPRSVGPYRLEAPLGGGASSEVWRARAGDQPVALKIARSGGGRIALQREVQALRAMQHPGVVRLVGAANDHAWLALELIDGHRGSDWAASQGIASTCSALERLAQTLDALHERGFAHGDIKPTNLLIDASGAPWLIDLGLAVGPGLPQTTTGFHGTLGYAAPEQLGGSPASGTTDVYSLGGTAWRMLTGAAPFAGVSTAGLAWVPCQRAPAPHPTLPKRLAAALVAMLSPNPDHRPSTASCARAFREGAADADNAPSADDVLDALQGGPCSVHHLACRLGMTELHLLDLVDPLLDAGAICEMAGGATLALA